MPKANVTKDITQLTPTQIQMIQDWEKASQKLSKLKRLESALRDLVVEQVFPGLKQAKGTEYAALANGYRLKAEGKLNYSIDEAPLQDIFEAVPQTRKAIKYKPGLAMREYNSLPDAAKKALAPAITVTPGKPQLTLLDPPKEKR